MTTPKDHLKAHGVEWKRAEKDLSEILASMGEKPIYQWRLNRLRAGYKPTQPEVRALYEYIGLTDFRDDPSQPFKSRRYSSK